MPALLDRLQRPLRSLRVSVTDRCNLRCSYCMPERDYVWLPRTDLLDFDEIDQLVGVFTTLGVDAVRLTGGEPLLRRSLSTLVRKLAERPALRDLALTTNGILLEAQAADLRAAGLHRITVSLDTLRPDRFRALTRRDDLQAVLAGLEAVGQAGFRGTKIDTVVLRGLNDDELDDLLEYGRSRNAEVRFIEYMDVGGATRWSMADVVSRDEMLTVLAKRYGPIEPVEGESSAPAARFRLPDGLVFGIIASTTQPFCSSCDRSRLTADGMWLLCLYAMQGLDLRGPLRAGEPLAEIADRIARAWSERQDRGAEERLATQRRDVFVDTQRLRADPHLEMHTRGG